MQLHARWHNTRFMYAIHEAKYNSMVPFSHLYRYNLLVLLLLVCKNTWAIILSY